MELKQVDLIKLLFKADCPIILAMSSVEDPIFEEIQRCPAVPSRLLSYRTNPSSLLDIFWPLERRFMGGKEGESEKVSFFQHWHTVPRGVKAEGLLVPGTGNPRERFNLGNIPVARDLESAGMHFKGQTVRFITPGENGHILENLLERGWRYGFRGLGEDTRYQFCSVILRMPAGILIAEGDIRIFGFAADSLEEIPLIITEKNYTRRDLPNLPII